MTHPRREGVADSLGQAFMHAGILDDQPRVRELIHLATANRGARAMGSLRFWAGELDYEGWNRYDAEMSVYGSTTLDESDWWKRSGQLQHLGSQEGRRARTGIRDGLQHRG